MYLTLLFHLLQKIIWIGPVKFRLPSQVISGASKLVSTLDRLTQSNCKITIIGKMACQAVTKDSSFISDYNLVKSASVMWEFLKGKQLPGLMALDRVCFLSLLSIWTQRCNWWLFRGVLKQEWRVWWIYPFVLTYNTCKSSLIDNVIDSNS